MLAAETNLCSNSVIRFRVKGVRSDESTSRHCRPSWQQRMHGRLPLHDSFLLPMQLVRMHEQSKRTKGC